VGVSVDYRRCGYCGRWFRQNAGPGRRKDYCDKPCRRRAQRVRDGKGVRATTRARRRGAEAVEELMARVTGLSEAEFHNAPFSVRLAFVGRVAGALDDYREVAVREAVGGGVGWDVIAAATVLDEVTARSRWGPPQERRPRQRALASVRTSDASTASGACRVGAEDCGRPGAGR
jgi:hypothetical protein